MEPRSSQSGCTKRPRHRQVEPLQWAVRQCWMGRRLEDINAALRAYNPLDPTQPPWKGTVKWNRYGSVLFQSCVITRMLSWMVQGAVIINCRFLWSRDKHTGKKKQNNESDYCAGSSFRLFLLVHCWTTAESTKRCFIICVWTRFCSSPSEPSGPNGNIYELLSYWMLTFTTVLRKNTNVLIASIPKKIQKGGYPLVHLSPSVNPPPPPPTEPIENCL